MCLQEQRSTGSGRSQYTGIIINHFTCTHIHSEDSILITTHHPTTIHPRIIKTKGHELNTDNPPYSQMQIVILITLMVCTRGAVAAAAGSSPASDRNCTLHPLTIQIGFFISCFLSGATFVTTLWNIKTMKQYRTQMQSENQKMMTKWDSHTRNTCNCKRQAIYFKGPWMTTDETTLNKASYHQQQPPHYDIPRRGSSFTH